MQRVKAQQRELWPKVSQVIIHWRDWSWELDISVTRPNFERWGMAEAPNLYSESLEKLDQELTCPICRKHFEEPKLLQCCHYYCRECIVQMRAKRTTFSAPNVVRRIRLPGDDPKRWVACAGRLLLPGPRDKDRRRRRLKPPATFNYKHP